MAATASTAAALEGWLASTQSMVMRRGIGALALQRRPYCSTSRSSTQTDRLLPVHCCGAGLLDTRPSPDFLERHLPRSLSIPWDANSKQRLFELPPREVPFGVLVREHEREEVIECLRSGRWEVPHVLIDSDELWEAAAKAGILESGVSKHIMFEPCAFFAEVFPPIDADLAAHKDGGKVTMCDLGCGSGRDAVWAGLRGWRVVGIDNLPAAVARVDAIAQRMGIDVTATVLDVNNHGDMERFIADAGPFDVVVCVRFLQRECFDSIAQLVAPGGFLVYQHFREGVQHSRIGRPNHPRHILQDGELRSVFEGKHGMRCLMDRSDTLDDGRPVCNFLAQRPLAASPQ